MEASQQPLSLSQQNLALNIAEKGKEDAEEGGRRGRRTEEGKEDAENTERMHRCRTSAIRHTALGLSGWQSPPGLSLGPFLLARPPSNQQRWSPIPRPSGPFSSPVPRATSNAGVALRETTVNDPAKPNLIEKFRNLGVTLLYGDLNNHESLVKAIKQVDVVISTVGFLQTADQTKIIAAIKEAGNIKRFFPSEFGNDVDRVNVVEPAKSMFDAKVQIRRAIEAEGIPHTYVSSNCFAGYLLPSLAQPGATSVFLSQSGATSPPRDKVTIFGDGNPKAVFNKEEDIGTYTIRAVDDPRTLNKILFLKPPQNIYSFNELVALWEKKIGNVLEKVYVPEDKLLKDIEAALFPIKLILAINHSVFVNGDQTKLEIEPSFGVEAYELYPDVKYTTVDEYLDQFV